MRIAITSPNNGAYSETFIAMQLNAFPDAMHIMGRPVATETRPGGAISLFQLFKAGMLHPMRIWASARAGDQAKSSLRALWVEAQKLAVAGRLRRFRPSVVLANYGPSGAAMLDVTRSLGIPLVVHFHGVDAHLTSMVNAYRNEYERMSREAAAVIVVSNAMKYALLKLGFQERKIHLLRCGVDLNQFSVGARSDKQRLFFSLGRFVDKKAPYLTCLAFKKVHARFPDAKLVIGGDGPLLEATANIASVLVLDDAILLPGKLTREEVVRYMTQAVAYVQHSITPVRGEYEGDSEGTPVSVMEAMAMGLPVVATAHTGITEIVEHGVDGFLSPERDIDQMAANMISILESGDALITMASNARLKAEKQFSKDDYLDGIERVLRSVCKYKI